MKIKETGKEDYLFRPTVAKQGIMKMFCTVNDISEMTPIPH